MKYRSSPFVVGTICFFGGWIAAEGLPFQLKQDLVRAVTDATMPTTSGTVGKTIVNGGCAIMFALTGISVMVAMHSMKFPLWLSAASWLLLLSALAASYFPMIVVWMMLPLGYLLLLGLAHLWAARLAGGKQTPNTLPRDPPSTSSTRQVRWLVAAALWLALPCAIGLPYVGGGVGPLPWILYSILTETPGLNGLLVIWSLYAFLLGILALVVSGPISLAWSYLPRSSTVLTESRGTVGESCSCHSSESENCIRNTTLLFPGTIPPMPRSFRTCRTYIVIRSPRT